MTACLLDCGCSKRLCESMLLACYIVTAASVYVSLCCCADAAKFQQLAEEARKQKQAKRHARKERKKPVPPKPQDEAVIRLAEYRAKVMKQERELHRAKAEQQKAELAAKRKLLLQRERAARQGSSPNTCDPDEGNVTTLAHSKAPMAPHCLMQVALL